VNTRTVLAGLLCWSVAGLAWASPLVPVPSPIAVLATGSPVLDETEDLVGRIRILGDRVPVETLTRLAKIGTPEALAGFELALDGGALTTPVARARALRALIGFAKSKEVGGRVREMLANQAANARTAIEGLAAIETLAASGGVAREWLRLVVDSNAPSTVRVRALELHASGYESASDRDYYQRLWSESQAPAPIPASAPVGAEPNAPAAPARAFEALGAIAFEVLAGDLDEATLKTAMAHPNARVRTAAMLELSDRGDKSMAARARATYANRSYPTAERAAAALVHGRLSGWDDVLKEVGYGLEPVSPDGRTLNDTRAGMAFANELAALIVARGEASFVKAVLDAGAGLQPASARAFCARAIGRSADKAAERFLRDLLEDGDLMVRVEALRALVRRGTDGARKLLEQQRSKAPTDAERGILVELTTELYGGDPKWIGELEALARGPATIEKNAAIASLARVGGDYEELFAAALAADAPWGTQRAAVQGLRTLCTREAVSALIAALERVDGRAEEEVLETLRRMTGERFASATVWPKWWQDNGAAFAPLTEAEYEDLIAKRGAQEQAAPAGAEGRTVVGSFFGIELDSERLTFVIDASGSMQEPMAPRSGGGPAGPVTGGGGGGAPHVPKGANRLEVAKNELLHFLAQLPATAMVNVVRFSTDANVWSDRLKSVAQKKTFDSIRAYVERLAPEGQTNVHAALRLAFEDPDVDTIMFLSDGAPSAGEVQDLLVIAEHVRIWNANRGVTLHVLSIGVDQPILRNLAESTGGSYTFIR